DDEDDDDMDIEADDDEEEEEHSAPANSVVVALPTTDQAPSAEETEPFETDESAATSPPHPAYRVTARISIPTPVPTPLWSDAEVAILLAISTPPSSPLSPWSSPLPQIPSPSLPLSPPSPSEEDKPEVTLPPRKRLGIALGPGYEIVPRDLEAIRCDVEDELPAERLCHCAHTRSGLDLRDQRLLDSVIQEQAVTSEIGYSTTGTGDHLAGAGDSPTRTGGSITGTGHSTTGAGYRTTGTTGTRWRSCIARAARGGCCIFHYVKKMAPKRATRSTPVTTTPAPIATTTTSVTNAQLQAMIDQGVTAALGNPPQHPRDAKAGLAKTATLSGTWWQNDERIDGDYFRHKQCPVENQVKFSTCTLLAGALTWWNSHVMTISHDAAYAMTWADLRKKITDKYCLRNEMKKLKAELVEFESEWMFLEESDKIKRYVSGLPDMIHGSIVASKPKTMQEAVEMATEQMG
ncbi:hypothetical protein Tco_0559262, partial [Tanacetum coccineum]